MHTPWFKLNKWKTGWMPIAWQGWIVMLVYLAALIYDFITINQRTHSLGETIQPFIFHLIVLSGFLSIICYFTAEKSAELLP